MKNFSVILSSLLLILILTTFNPNNLNQDFHILKIKEVEIKNIQILDKNKMKNLFFTELFDTSLIFLDKKKIKKITNNNKLIDYIEFKKIYPSKLVINIFEKKIIAIINYKQNKFYLTENGEEVLYFQSPMLKELPNIFGRQKNFLDLYITLKDIGFPTQKIKSFYYFEIGRWDIILKNDKVIKLPIKDFSKSLKNFMDFKQKINFEKYSIFDYRIKEQLILN